MARPREDKKVMFLGLHSLRGWHVLQVCSTHPTEAPGQVNNPFSHKVVFWTAISAVFQRQQPTKNCYSNVSELLGPETQSSLAPEPGAQGASLCGVYLPVLSRFEVSTKMAPTSASVLRESPNNPLADTLRLPSESHSYMVQVLFKLLLLCWVPG